MNLGIIINLRPTVDLVLFSYKKEKSILNPRLIGALSNHAFNF